jgi:hypothetical protein
MRLTKNKPKETMTQMPQGRPGPEKKSTEASNWMARDSRAPQPMRKVVNSTLSSQKCWALQGFHQNTFIFCPPANSGKIDPEKNFRSFFDQ